MNEQGSQLKIKHIEVEDLKRELAEHKNQHSNKDKLLTHTNDQLKIKEEDHKVKMKQKDDHHQVKLKQKDDDHKAKMQVVV